MFVEWCLPKDAYLLFFCRLSFPKERKELVAVETPSISLTNLCLMTSISVYMLFLFKRVLQVASCHYSIPTI